MSGFEIAGIVLGAVPLIISALEHYEDVIDPTVAFFQWRGQLSKAIDELSVVYASYDQTLRLLLQPVVSQEEVVEMMENTNDPLWMEGDIFESLQTHFGTAWKPCRVTIEEIAESLVEISKHLNIAGAQLESQKDLRDLVNAHQPISQALTPKSRYKFKGQIKFTMKRRRLKAQIERIELCLKRLSDFTERAEKLDDGPPKARWKVKFSGPLTVIRENASKIHSTLTRSWCPQHSDHRAGLHLEQRLLRPRKKTLQGTQPHVAQSDCFALSIDEHATKRVWMTTEFRITDIASPKQSQVTFTVTAPSTSDPPPPYMDPSSLPKIEEICAYLKNIKTTSIGFCFDQNHKLCSYLRNSAPDKYLPQEITLEKILPKLPQRLSNGDVYNLAITLIASVFQLTDTPWLNQTWTKSAIMFLKPKPGTASEVDITHPILMQRFNSRIASNSPNEATSSTRKALLALGILLLEIHSTQPIETMRKPEDLPPNLPAGATPGLDSDHRTAIRCLFEQVSQGNITRGFCSAITNCLQAYINPQADFSNAEFCRSIEETVLRPLEEERKFLVDGPGA